MALRQLSFLVLTLCTISVSAQVFVSIDCGSSTSSRDENLIPWTGDDEYITTGESRKVPSSNSISRVMDTMRVFTTHKKNCYHIDSITKGRVLVRASFFYGNYDNRSSPPTFDLQFDGNHWMTVETSNTDYVSYEVIYVMKRDNISVCLAQTERDHYPFISALEVRGLGLFMYSFSNDTNRPLFLGRRDAFGSNSSVRYPNDPYDRIWDPISGNNELLEVTSTAQLDGDTRETDRPPPAVLRNAITPSRPNSSIQLVMGFPPYNVSPYMNWYFSEVYELGLNETRSFQFFLDQDPFYVPIGPPYGNYTEVYGIGSDISSNNTISLVPTNDSTLPPLINAMEVFYIGDPLTNGTDTRDAQGLTSLRRAFTVLQDWNGDPCLPAPYSWDWIECSNGTTPRVTALFLGSFGLLGTLPDFSSMDALRTIDLHNNSLSGPIPDFLGTLPDLKQLNLANNHFNGSIPSSISQKNGLNLVVNGNPELCTSSLPCPAPDSSRNQTRSSSAESIKNTNNLSRLFGITVSSFIIMILLFKTIL